MDVANYVNNVGKQVNDFTKYCAMLDRTSITNITLIYHLAYIYNRLKGDIESSNVDYTQEDLDKIEQYILNLKKEVRFYETKRIDPDCILTEVDENIIQE